MWKKTIVWLSFVGLLYGCGPGKSNEATLQSKVDSLTTELETNRKAAATLQEVAALLDSIDANRNALRTRMFEGTNLEDYTGRMRQINAYVKDAQGRIVFLEERVKSLKNSSSSYTSAVKKMKHELETRNQELAALQDQVAKYRNENDNLIQTVNLQKAEIDDKIDQLQWKALQIDTLERSVNTLIAEIKLDAAEAYYKQAQAVEETANRTRFAPRKKRNTRKEALELYKLAALFGKDEAQARIEALQKKI